MRQRRVLLVAAVCLLAVLAPHASAVAATADATKSAKVPPAGISLRYPATWAIVPLTQKALEAQIKLLSKKNPKLAEAMNSAGSDAIAQQMKFRAQDLTGGASNVSVQALRGRGPASLDDFTSVIAGEYKTIGATVLDTSEQRVSGTPGYRADVSLTVTLPDGSSTNARLGQLIIQNGSKLAIVTAASEDSAAGEQVIDQILGSVRLL